MNREEIIEMVEEAGPLVSTPFDVWCERFADLVAAAEREACAQTIERARLRLDLAPFVVNFLAAAVRKRGEQE